MAYECAHRPHLVEDSATSLLLMSYTHRCSGQGCPETFLLRFPGASAARCRAAGGRPHGTVPECAAVLGHTHRTAGEGERLATWPEPNTDTGGEFISTWA